MVKTAVYSRIWLVERRRVDSFYLRVLLFPYTTLFGKESLVMKLVIKYVYMYVCMYVCMNVCVYVCTFVYLSESVGHFLNETVWVLERRKVQPELFQFGGTRGGVGGTFTTTNYSLARHPLYTGFTKNSMLGWHTGLLTECCSASAKRRRYRVRTE